MAGADFVEVYVKVSVDAAAKRDPKGLYKKAMAGQIKGFTGVDDPYEAPVSPEMVVDTECCTPEEAAAQLFSYLERHSYLEA
jgi:adenylylsulfate kinase